MTRLLITGASGLLGGNLVRDFASQHDVSGVYHSHRLVVKGAKMIRADLSDPELVGRVVGKVQPEILIHCAAATDVDRCERDEAWAWQLNRDMAAQVAQQAARVGAKMIHISTDAVFDGQDAGYDEEATPEPINVYGESKLAGEGAVQDANRDALVLRTNLFGLSVSGRQRGLLAWFRRRLEAGEPTPGFGDVWFSPILVNTLGEWLLELAEADVRGILHVGGGTCMTKYEFGREVARSFGLDPGLVRRSTVDEAGLEAPRPRRLCLDSSKAADLLGRRLPEVSDGLERLRGLLKEEPTEQVQAG